MRLQLLAQFEDMVKQYQRDIVSFHYRMVGNTFEAEDLAQETFIKAYKKLDSMKDKKKVKSWLYAIARNTTIDFFRKNKNRSVPLDSTVLENYAEATAVDYRSDVMRREVSKEVQHHLGELPREDQMIVRLLYYEGFSYSEICELLHMNQNTLKSRLHRARKMLLAAVQANNLLREAVLDYQQ
jgi:RNA polymerase sigma-70 factor, ECF subfamily